MAASNPVGDALAENRRRAEVFRKGRIVAIDETGDLVLVTVHDGEATRVMSTTETVAVGDTGVWYDGPDPFFAGVFVTP